MQSETVRDLTTVLAAERHVIHCLEQQVDEAVADAVAALKHCQGHIVVCGLGSLGSSVERLQHRYPALVHARTLCTPPKRATRDLLEACATTTTSLALSASGETAEVIQVAKYVKQLGCKVISVTSNPKLEAWADIGFV